MEQFITILYCLAENCSYSELKETIIRKRIIVEILKTGVRTETVVDFLGKKSKSRFKCRRQPIPRKSQSLKSSSSKCSRCGSHSRQQKMQSAIPVRRKAIISHRIFKKCCRSHCTLIYRGNL